MPLIRSDQVHMIDNTTSANLLWQGWGSPAVPTAAQIEELKTCAIMLS